MNTIDPLSFKDFYTSFYNRSFLFAKSYVHDDSVAEDIASEALIKLWEMSKSQKIDNPKFILFTLLKHKSLDFLKHEAVKQKSLNHLTYLGQRELEIRISTLEASNPEKIFESDIQEIIQATLIHLPKQTREIFEMSRFQNKEKKEIAEILGITVKGVDYHISKALKALKNNLKDYFPIVMFLLF
ncbi:RNA polymerase sigma-70 factor [Massilibacteroides sp.]|uniref:RNA polymerase sigma-70 factor n=1 Tax=Massilibacteroides sp. TaxID=2034766 RepID=UPI0026063275|nr:RNA polymerase sigma-70 factor [Massilibacteroides sp.]MDD4516714.1 RNA polymerase sigma-70 factor [Massilibacteroides sp.]